MFKKCLIVVLLSVLVNAQKLVCASAQAVALPILFKKCLAQVFQKTVVRVTGDQANQSVPEVKIDIDLTNPTDSQEIANNTKNDPFQIHKEKMQSVFAALSSHRKYNILTNRCLARITEYNNIILACDRWANEFLKDSEDALRTAFFMCPSDRKKQQCIESSQYCCDQAQFTKESSDDFVCKMSDDIDRACESLVKTLDPTDRRRVSRTHSIVKKFSQLNIGLEFKRRNCRRSTVSQMAPGQEYIIEWSGALVRKRIQISQRLEQQRHCLALFSNNDQCECKENKDEVGD